ncbi:MAG: ABC transporter substrate-binding protein [Nitrospinae bacterium]|nr:ABC transporter substrate-binding protein [Nitrospinota bacterium]
MLITIGLVVTLGLSIFSAPLGAAPAGKVHRIGFLLAGPAPSEAEWQRSPFLRELRELGYVEGQNITIERRYAEGNIERLATFAAELVRINVDLIVVGGNTLAEAAKQASSSIPIVVTSGIDLVDTGLIASLARPGGNITGLIQMTPELSGKQLELLKEAIPTLSRVAVLWNSRSEGMTRIFRGIQGAARTLGVKVQPLGVQDPNDFDGAFAEMTETRPDALFLIGDPFTARHRSRILDFAASRLPTMFIGRGFVDAGGLMSYGPSRAERWRRAAHFVDRILKGAKPADLPVEHPMTFELVINLKTANALGLTIPPTLLFQATEVIR